MTALPRTAAIVGSGNIGTDFKHAERVAHRYGVSGTEILRRAGERALVGGQEDQLLDTAVELASLSRREDSAGVSA